MGQAKVNQSATAKLIAEFPDCALCGGDRPSTTREHMPPKALFDRSHRPDKLVVPACGVCNKTSSKADLTVAIISRWRSDSDEQELADHAKLARQAKTHAPELVSEWNALGYVQRKKARRHLEAQGVAIPPGARVTTIGELTIRQLNIFAHKATLALYFEHFRRPLTNAGRVCAYWRTKEDFAVEGLPRRLLEIFPRYQTLLQGIWSTPETFECRYDINVQEGLFGFIARLRQGMMVFGFVVEAASKLTPELGDDWIKPNQLFDEIPQLYKKN
jgi:hypothetical protein